jgi:hypothetical protein
VYLELNVEQRAIALCHDALVLAEDPTLQPGAIATAKVIRTFLIVETLDLLSFCLLPSAFCPVPSAFCYTYSVRSPLNSHEASHKLAQLLESENDA